MYNIIGMVNQEDLSGNASLGGVSDGKGAVDNGSGGMELHRAVLLAERLCHVN